MSLSSNAFLIYLITKVKPEAWDAIIPHGPKISVGTRDVASSMIIKTVAKAIVDPKLSYELDKLGKSLFEQGTTTMSASYDYDDWCGTPYPHHWPLPFPFFEFEQTAFTSIADEVMLNPQPLPPHDQRYFGGVLSLVALSVSSKEIGAQLNKISEQLLKEQKRAISAHS